MIKNLIITETQLHTTRNNYNQKQEGENAHNRPTKPKFEYKYRTKEAFVIPITQCSCVSAEDSRARLVKWHVWRSGNASHAQVDDMLMSLL